MIVGILLAAGLSISRVSHSTVAASVSSASTSGFFPERRQPFTAPRRPNVNPGRQSWSHRPGTGGEDGESDDGGGTTDDDDDDIDLYHSHGPLTSQSDKAIPPIGSQPLQTLEKLQQMLDATDYITENQRRSAETSALSPTPSSFAQLQRERRPPSTSTTKLPPPPPPPPNPGKLWMSGDRAKYKKSQHRLRQVDTTKWLDSSTGNKVRPSVTVQQRTTNPREKKSHPAANLLDEEDDFSDATDDGLGYTLPDLPVYNSDVEDNGDIFAKDDVVSNGHRLVSSPASQLEGRDYNSPGRIYPSAHHEAVTLPPNFQPNHSREQSTHGATYFPPQEHQRPPQWTAPPFPYYHTYNPYMVYPMQYGDAANRAAFLPPVVQGYSPHQQQSLYSSQRATAVSGHEYSPQDRQQRTVPTLDGHPTSISSQLPATGTTEIPVVSENVDSMARNKKAPLLPHQESMILPSRPVGSLTSVTTLLPASSQILLPPPQLFPTRDFPDPFVDERFQQVCQTV
jgi:hypothetical protein